MTAFPGGTSVSRLAVYTGACADGLEGGTPHLHTASTEAYVVTGGRGALQTLDMNGLRETELTVGTTVWFTPGTIHRAVNRGGLEVVVVMQNAGLPEAGDAVMTFPPEVVSDRDAYQEAAGLPPGGEEAAVARRRDLAVEGFLRLAESARAGDYGPLLRFYDSAVALVRPKVAGWRRIWETTVAAGTRDTAEVLDALGRGDGIHLRHAMLLEAPPQERWGMCGHLRAHDVTRPIVHAPVHPSTHPPVKPSAHSPVSQPTHSPADPPAHAPVSEPAHPPVSEPAHPPVKPSAHSPVSQPAHSPVDSPAHPPVDPPAHAPVHPPVRPASGRDA
ncbi:cupin domain-containing protein [Nonomuraea sp. NPDC049486]|uniref:cupin domain-containing protein n=1 Tax=Nonomuraea sp. NPDC049486 TaxID=3155773 RepID=UPI003428006E